MVEADDATAAPHDASREDAAAWIRICRSLAEVRLRQTRAQQLLLGAPLDTGVRALDRVCQLAEDGDPGGQQVILSLIPLVVDPERLATLLPLRRRADELNLISVQRWLAAATSTGHHLDKESRVDTNAIAQHADGRPLALGERRALARQPSRQKIVRLLVDPSPMVVRLLLRNPRITEDDVVRMAARQPGRRENSVEMAKAWPQSPRVRFTLISNPYTPPAVAVPLLPLLNRADLRDVRRATNLAAIVRSTAGDIATLRPPMAKLDTSHTPSH